MGVVSIMAFLSGDDLNRDRIQRMRCLMPDLTTLTPTEITMYLPCLSSYDREKVSCSERNSGPLMAAQCLFDLTLWKKPGWYEQLLNALRRTGNSDLAERLDAPERQRRMAASVPPEVEGTSGRQSHGPVVQETSSGSLRQLEPEACVSKSSVASPECCEHRSSGNEDNMEMQRVESEKQITGIPASGNYNASHKKTDSPCSVSQSGSHKVPDLERGHAAGSVPGVGSPAATVPPIGPPPDSGQRLGATESTSTLDGPVGRRPGGVDAAPSRVSPPQVGQRMLGEGGRDVREEGGVETSPAAAPRRHCEPGVESRGQPEETKQCDDINRNMDTASSKKSPKLHLPSKPVRAAPSELNDLSPTKRATPKFNILPSPERGIGDGHQAAMDGSGGCDVTQSQGPLSLSSTDTDPRINAACEQLRSSLILISKDEEEGEGRAGSETGNPAPVDNGRDGGFLQIVRKAVQVGADALSDRFLSP